MQGPGNIKIAEYFNIKTLKVLSILLAAGDDYSQ
jgi:hypothetical protein